MTPRDLLIFGALIALGCIAGVVHLVTRHLNHRHEERKVEVQSKALGNVIVQDAYLTTLQAMLEHGQITRLGAVLSVNGSLNERPQA